MSVDLTRMQAIVDWMRGNRVYAFKNGEVSIEISLDEAPPPMVVAELPGYTAKETPPPVACKCGHDLDTEHNEFGCLHGCSEATCWADRTEVRL